MKTILATIAAAALLSAGTALADSPQWQLQRDLQRRLAVQRQQDRLERAPAATTVAIYTQGRGVGAMTNTGTQPEERWVILPQGRGEHIVVRRVQE